MKLIKIKKFLRLCIFAAAIIIVATLSFSAIAYLNTNFLASASIVNEGGSITYSYTGGVQSFTPVNAGYYQVELWGASGGDSDNAAGGNGTYLKGTVLLGAGEIVYLQVGQSGNGITSETYNGGGSGAGSYSSKAGGGATDIRLLGGAWNNFDSLKSRIMVAAGGGGADGYSGGSIGGTGGLFEGGNGTFYGGAGYVIATGAGQTYGGAGGSGAYSAYNGIFGKGGNCNAGHGGGGGGGYYGGGGGCYNGGVVGSGGGGSSFISGVEGCKAIDFNSTASDVIHKEDSYHYSGKVFTDIAAVAGNRDGHGQAKITLLKKADTLVQVTTSAGYVVAAQGVSYSPQNYFSIATHTTTGRTIGYQAKNIATGNVQNITNINILAIGEYQLTCTVAVDGKSSSAVLNLSIRQSAVISPGTTAIQTYNYNYTGGAQSFTVTQSGYYQIELWGASGAGNGNTKGAYTKGTIYLEKGVVLYVYVGKDGAGTPVNTYSFNGGGPSPRSSAGGGATDIRLSGGAWDNYDGLKSRIMVASGGGGHNGYTHGDTGAHGGTINGNNGLYNTPVVIGYSGKGATQTAGGVGCDHNIASSTGGFGKGGLGQPGTPGDSGHMGGGGGGGYYGGGGSGWHASAGSGSSFISGYSGCNAVAGGSSASNHRHSGSPAHYSGRVFSNSSMLDGSQSPKARGNGGAVISLLHTFNEYKPSAPSIDTSSFRIEWGKDGNDDILKAQVKINNPQGAKLVSFPTALVSSQTYSNLSSYVYAGYPIGDNYYEFAFKNTYKNAAGTFTPYIIKATAFTSPSSYITQATLVSSVYVDNTAPATPVINLSRVQDYYYAAVDASPSGGADGQSGQTGYEYKIDEGSWIALALDGKIPLSSSVSGLEKVTLSLRSKDKANNYSQQTIKEINFDRTTYAINYVLGDYIYNHSSNPHNYNVETPSITIYEPQKTGFLFDAWYEDATFTSPAIPAIARFSRGDKTFYAKFNIDTSALAVTNQSQTEYQQTYNTQTITALSASASHPAEGQTSYEYQWEMSLNNGVSYNEISSQDTTTYTVPELIDSGTYHIRIKARANNSSQTTAWVLGSAIKVSVLPKYIATSWSPVPFDVVFNGERHTPTITLTDPIGNRALALDEDISVSYGANTLVGTASVMVSGKNNYQGEASYYFQISKKTIRLSGGNPTITAVPIAAQQYTGNEIYPQPVIKDIYRDVLLNTDDYNLIYYTNINVGEASVSVAGKGNYMGTVSLSFDITPKPIVLDSTVLATPILPQVFVGNAITPVPTILDISRGVGLDEDDFNYTYSNNINVGQAQITLIGENNYSGEAYLSFDIFPKAIVAGENAEVAEIAYFVYNGAPHLPTPSVTDTDRNYTLETLEYAYSDNIYASKDAAKVTITVGGNYSGTIVQPFEIQPKELTLETLEIEALGNYIYTGSPIEPTPFVRDTDLDTFLTESDIVYAYVDNVNAYGSPKVIITGINNYCGEIIVDFSIEKIGITPVFDGANDLVYDGELKSITATAIGIAGEQPILSVSYDLAPINAGEYIATAALTGADVNGNYRLIGDIELSFSIAQKGARVTFGDYEGLIYSGLIREISVSFSHFAEDIIEGENPTLTLEYSAPPLGSGNYTATASLLDSNYIIEGNHTQNFSIAKRQISIGGAYFTKFFGEPDPAFSTLINSGTADGEIQVTYKRDRTSANTLDYQDTGFYPFIGVQSENTNYDIAFDDSESGGLTISKANMYINPRQFQKTYGDADPVLSEVINTGFYGVILNVNYVRNVGENAGTYDLVSLLADNSSRLSVFFAENAEKNKVIIQPKSLRMHIPEQGKLYGDTEPVYDYYIFSEDLAAVDAGMPIEELLGVSIARPAGENYREQGYLLTPTMSNTNYTIDLIGDSIFYIERFVIQIIEEYITLSKIYDANARTEIDVTTSLSSGLARDSGFVATANFAKKDVGENIDILIEYSVNSESANNFVTPQNKTVQGGEIKSRVLTALIFDRIMQYGDIPPLPAIIYTNFAIGENETNIGLTAPTVDYGDLTSYSAVGSYTIGLLGGTAPNYTIDISSTAVFTVIPAPLTIGAGKTYVKTVDGNNFASLTSEHYTVHGIKNDDDVKINFRAYLLNTVPGNTFVEMVNIHTLNPNYTIAETSIRLGARIRSLPYVLMPNLSVSFTGAGRSVSVSVTLDGMDYYGYVVTYRSKDYPESIVSPINAGEYTAKIIVSGDDFEEIIEESTLIITPIAPTLKISGETKQTYGSFTPFTARVTAILLDENVPVRYSFANNPEVGDHMVYANYLGSRNYYPVTASMGFSVAKKNISVVFHTAQDLVYNGLPQSISASFTGLAYDDEVTPIINYSSGTAPIAAGTYTATVALINHNYLLTGNVSTRFTIAKKTLVVGIVPGEIKQGSSPDSLIVYNGFADGDDSSSLEFSPKARLIVGSDGSKFAVLENGKASNYNIVLDEKQTTANIEIIHPETHKEANSNWLYYVIGGVAGAAALIVMLVIINKKRMINSLVREQG